MIFRRKEVLVALSIGIAVLVLIIAAFAFIATRPSSFRYQRTAHVSAPPHSVFAIINDLHQFEFSRPFKATNEVNFVLVPSDGGTRVSWIMDGKKNFMSKAMSLVMDMDKMVGTDFEQGLANLNTVAQAGAPSAV